MISASPRSLNNKIGDFHVILYIQPHAFYLGPLVTMDRRQGAPKINDDVEAAMRSPPPLILFWSSTTMMMLLVGFG